MHMLCSRSGCVCMCLCTLTGHSCIVIMGKHFSQVISSAYWNHMIISSSSKLIPELQQQKKMKDFISLCWQSACFSKYLTSGGRTYCTFNDLSSKITIWKSLCLFNLVSYLPFKGESWLWRNVEQFGSSKNPQSLQEKKII